MYMAKKLDDFNRYELIKAVKLNLTSMIEFVLDQDTFLTIREKQKFKHFT